MPTKRTRAIMKELVSASKIKYLGLSEAASDTVRQAHAIHTLSAVQVEHNLWTHVIEQNSGTRLFKTCRDPGTAVVAYSPLRRGMLTGAHKVGAETASNEDNFQTGLAHFLPVRLTNNGHVIEEMRAVAEPKGCTPAQLALAWLLSQGDNVFVIPGIKKVKYFEENFGVRDVRMSGDEAQVFRKPFEESGSAVEKTSIWGLYLHSVVVREA